MTIADNVVARERELYQYDLNINNYEIMLAELPTGDWPEHLVQYKGKTADQVPDEHDDEVGDLNYRDRLRGLLKTERAERKKSELVYNTLIGQLPENETARASLLSEAVARIA